MVSLLSTKFHEILFSSFRGVALTNCVTDRQTGQKQCLPTKVGGDIILILRVHTMLEWQDIFWLKCLVLDRRLHFSPITAVLLSQYKSEQHHVIAANAYLLFGQKSTNLTIFFCFHCTNLLYF